MKEKYGEDYFAKIGRKGGQVKNDLKGFGSNRELARKAGQKGGSISKRGKSIDFKLAYEKEGDTKAIYDTSNLGVDSDSVHGAGGVLRRAVDRVVGK